MSKIVSQLFILLFFVSCNYQSSDSCGFPYGMTKNSNEAKALGVFICYYKLSENSIKVKRYNFNLVVKEIYREYKFEINQDKIDILEASQIVIVFKDELPENYSIDWLIGDYKDLYFNQLDKYKIVVDLLGYDKNMDVLNFDIHEGRYSNEKGKKIGGFSLIAQSLSIKGTPSIREEKKTIRYSANF
jgi:hypothetical protein